jgi:hypothetical protein
MNELIMCCAEDCHMKDKCLRQTRSDPDDINEVSYDYSLTCTSESGFDSYILDTNTHT